FRRSVPHMLGVTGGFFIMVLSVGLGLGAVFQAVPGLYTILRYVGAAYLLYLAWNISRPVPASRAKEGTGHATPLGFLGAAAFQWVNPKAWTMAVAAVTTYAPQQDYVAGVMFISALFAVINLPCVSLWTGCGSLLRQVLDDPVRQRRVNLAMALLLVASLYPMLADA